MEDDSIASILAGSDPAPAPVEAKAEPVATDVTEATPSVAKAEPEKVEPVRDEKGKFTKREEKAEPMVPLSALLAERAKRQEKAEAPKEKPSFLENEDAAFTARATEAIDPIKESIFELSMEFARNTYSDFDDVAKAFADAAEKEPRLWDQMREARNPAGYVYKIGTQIKELGDVGGDIRRYKEKVTGELNQRLSAIEAENAELKKKLAEASTKVEIPRTLNRSTSSAPKEGDDGDEDITTLTRFGKTA